MILIVKIVILEFSEKKIKKFEKINVFLNFIILDSKKNLNFSETNLTNNPITNPVNSYSFNPNSRPNSNLAN